MVRERVDLAKSKGTFWQDDKFTNPLTKAVEPKQSDCEKLSETVVCGGVYRLDGDARLPALHADRQLRRQAHRG